MDDLFRTWNQSQQAFWNTIGPARATQANGTVADDTPPLENHFSELQRTWQASIQQWVDLAKEGATRNALTPEALRQMFAPNQWSGVSADMLDVGLKQLVEGPRYATLWTLDKKLLELQKRRSERDKDIAAYQAVVQNAWQMAFERFTIALRQSKFATPASWRELADRWLAVANDTLTEVHRSDEFLEAQRRMLRSASDHRLQERLVAETFCEAQHIPTRTEMDEVQRTVCELRRQLRTLQRAKAPATTGNASPRARATKATRPVRNQ